MDGIQNARPLGRNLIPRTRMTGRCALAMLTHLTAPLVMLGLMPMNIGATFWVNGRAYRHAIV